MFSTSPDSLLAAHALADTLSAARAAYPLPHRLRSLSGRVATCTLEVLFPQFSETCCADAPAVASELAALGALLRTTLGPLVPDAAAVTEAYVAALPGVRAALLEDASATFAGDPAATSVDEVILAYPGFLATAYYRLARVLYREGVPLVPRLIAEHGHRLTGIDLHPGATHRPRLRHRPRHGRGHRRNGRHRGRACGSTRASRWGRSRSRRRWRSRSATPRSGTTWSSTPTPPSWAATTVVGARQHHRRQRLAHPERPPDSIVTHAAQVRRAGQAPEPLLDYYL